MPLCRAILRTGPRAGEQCRCFTKANEVVCGRHESQRAAVIAANMPIHWGPIPANPLVAAPGARFPAAAPAAPAPAAPAPAVPAPAVAARQAKIDRNNHLIANAHHLSAVQIISYAQRLMKIAEENNIPGDMIAKAYTILKYVGPLSHGGFPELMSAAVAVVRMDNNYHPDAIRYADVPAAERAAGLERLRVSVARYTLPNWANLVREDDPYRARIRMRAEAAAAEAAAAAQAAAAAAQAAAAAAARQREEARQARRAARRDRDWDRQLREAPVVFQRDPEGSVNLRAFATDQQNIHRSSVQQTTEKAVYKIIERDVPADQHTIPEIETDFARKVRWTGVGTQERVVDELNRDYVSLEAFGIPYQAVLDRVWAYIRTHAERKELTIRLAQEMVEGLGMCSNGKMAHLINALQGYDAELTVSAPSREEFQTRIGALTSRPEGEREAAARALFAEFNIPEAEHAVWLEPLLA